MPTEKRQRQKEGRRARLEAERKRDRRRQLLRRVGFSFLGALVVVGIVLLALPGSTPLTAQQKDAALQQKINATAVAAGCPAQPPTSVKPGKVPQTWKHPPTLTIDRSATYVATMTTTAGTVKFALDPARAPVNVNNFVFLADHGFYTCNPFWRVIPNFMDQTGDPTGSGNGGPGYDVKTDEFPPAVHHGGVQYPNGTVAIANGGPHTNGSQFFIVDGPEGNGLPPQYTVIGHVISGMAAISRINKEGAVGVNAGPGYPPRIIERILSVTIKESKAT